MRIIKSYTRFFGAIIAISFLIIGVLGFFQHVAALESKRQKVVFEKQCSEYAYAIEKWAKQKGIENPCHNTKEGLI